MTEPIWTGEALEDRDFEVDEGDWDRETLYRGPSWWRAALAMARGRRDAVHLGVFAGYDSQKVIDWSGYDYADEGETTGLTDEEEDFFEQCKAAGAARKRRK